MREGTKIMIGAVVLVVVAAVAFLIDYLISVQRYKRSVANITYTHANASGIPDGVYIGECDVRLIAARVEVTVQDGQITNIDLIKHRHERGEAAEGIEKRIVAQQRIDVDAVSGATNSSQVIKKAVDNALSGARRN
jgi:uncharacterized protein with FMN-binding domain